MTDVSAPPASVVAALQLKPFYGKYVDARGLAVLSSVRASDYALGEAAFLIDRMLAGRDDLRTALIRGRVRCAVMAAVERTTDIPEHADLTPREYWNRRARGLGATAARPAVSCGEENLLGFPGDPYQGENILIHEFAHTIHEMGLRVIDPTFDGRLTAAYKGARSLGLFEGFYAATNAGEYWAEGVQSYFDCNGNHGPNRRVIATREDLLGYDPSLVALIAGVFPDRKWRYTPVKNRLRESHLRGYDPATAARFRW
jgi:hypothetical protein